MYGSPTIYLDYKSQSINHTSIILLSCWKVSVTSSSYFLHVVVHVMTFFFSCCSISPSFYRKNRIWIIPKCPLWSIPYYGWRDNSSTLHVHFQSSGKNAVTLPLFLLLPWNWMMLWNGIDFFTLLLPSSFSHSALNSEEIRWKTTNQWTDALAQLIYMAVK